MNKVLAINAGSSSLKFQLLEMPSEKVVVSGIVERIGLNDGIFTIKYDGEKDTIVTDIPNHEVAVQLVINGLIEKNLVKDLDEIIAVGHRVVHGGEYFNSSVNATDEVVEKVEEVADLAPLHNPANLTGFKAFKKSLPNATHTFSFDTAFHQTMEPDTFLYPLPYEYYTDLKVRRYGMHGISHDFVSHEVARAMGKNIDEINTITLHLGNGASISAIEKGKCINTSMGFTPLAGIMMGTRTGDIDPAIITYLMKKLDKTAEEIVDIYNKKSGMLGISGISSDARDIENAINEGNERAKLTHDIYVNRVLQVVGGYAFQLGHVDALVFTAGLGENDTLIRERVLDTLVTPMGIKYDKELNAKSRGKLVRISTDDSKVQVWVVPTNEELLIAKDAFDIHHGK